MGLENNRGIEEVQAELARVAREIARVLTTRPVDRARLDELDRTAAELRAETQRLQPAPPTDLRVGLRLVTGG